jgi:hypothetical protein
MKRFRDLSVGGLVAWFFALRRAIRGRPEVLALRQVALSDGDGSYWRVRDGSGCKVFSPSSEKTP